ncbi:MHO_1580 family protein [Mycoplasmopsis arginini]|uniref:MHO_1580 family protein n=1 Tax=Mycoplasmopsis arginini TaxID=2094 RepID=UPI000D60A9E1|nr:hypothetical protein [Mycoplasmopsis arginini]MDI3348236.1 hypothetical protein [Mycoplasmopsis arginini]PWC09053.1 hypothetical protein DIE66_00235 [Mycoplasmopsis arginini]
MIYNYEDVNQQKITYEYKEEIKTSIEKCKINNKNVDLGLNQNEKCEIEIIRNLNENSWVLEFIVPKRVYDSSRIKIIELNDKKLLIQDLEELENNRVRFKTMFFQDKTIIKFDDLSKLKFSFHSKWRKDFFNKLSFIINFNINKTNNDFTNINVRDKNLKFNFIESIKFDIENNVLPQLNPFQNNIAYYNNLIFNFNFFNLKQNEFLYKVLEKKIELKTPNRYYVPARNYNINFLNKILIKENNKDYSFDLIPKINTINKFKTNIEYFINKNNRWDNNQKEFFESKNGTLKGYHLPLKYNGDITIKFNLNQKLINNLKEIKYLTNFSHPLFNENNGLIKLNCQVINTTEEFQNLNYSDWTLKNL